MSVDGPDPRERAIQRLRVAQSAWGEAMTAHKLAPPDLGFAARLRSLAAAAEREREACEEADRAGLLWRPIPGAQGAQPPNELRPGTGRRGPRSLWERFDDAVRGAEPRHHRDQRKTGRSQVRGARIDCSGARRGRRGRGPANASSSCAAKPCSPSGPGLGSFPCPTSTRRLCCSMSSRSGSCSDGCCRRGSCCCLRARSSE